MEPQSHRGGPTGGRQYYYYADEDEDFSAEEIFNIFFGHSGMISEISKENLSFLSIYLGATTRTYRRRQQPRSFNFNTNSTQSVRDLLPFFN